MTQNKEENILRQAQEPSSRHNSTSSVSDQGGPQIIKDDEIDLIALIKTIWDGRKIICYSVGIAIFVGLIIVLFSPAKYTASATLLPSSERKGNFGNLGALAGMAGINLGSMMGDASSIPAEIYPQVVNSYPFQKELIHQKFDFAEYDEAISLYDYVVADTLESFGSKIIKYTIRLPWTLKDAFKNESEMGGQFKDYGVVNLSEEELRTLLFIKGLINIQVSEETGLVKVSVEAKEPIVTAQFVKKAVDLLQEYVINYKTKQARQNLEFVQERFDEKKKQYEVTQKAFFEYKDRHRNMISERIDVSYQQLSDEYEMISSVFKGLAQQLEQAKIIVMEETPAFTVLEPVQVPKEKSAPKKIIILFASVLFGGFIGLGVIFGKLLWQNVKTKIF